MRKSFFTVLLMIVTMLSVFAQEVTISGTVTDENGEGLPGATVQVKGTTAGTITNFDGTYSLKIAEENAILVYGFVGYESQEIAANGRTKIDVSLSLDLKQLEEVVVVGYGTMKKSDLTGAVTSIKSEDIAKIRSANVVEVLQGQAPGLDISRGSGRAGSGYDITLRGTRSITASNNPLYIVDGVPYGGNINIDANDIESIEVLKDASSTAIYGSRGANGVIIITTKKGNGAGGGAEISFNMYKGVTKRIGEIPLGDRDYFLNLYTDLQWSIDRARNSGALRDPEGYKKHLRAFEDENADVDWYDLVMQDGMQQNYNLSFSGSSENLAYSSSLSYYDEVGLIPNDRFQRMTFRLNLEGKLTDNVSIGASTVTNFNLNEKRTSPLGDARKLSPLAKPYDSLGNLVVYPRFKEEVRNPLLTLDRDFYFNESRYFRSFSTFYVNVNLLNKALNFRSSINFDLDQDRDGVFTGVYEGLNGISTAGVSQNTGTDYTFQNVLNYDKKIGVNHQLKVTLGSELLSYRNERYYTGVRDLSLPTSQWYAISGSDPSNISLNPGTYPLVETSLASFFGRVHYSLMDKYMFQITGRTDGSSVLATGNKWDFFPSASFAWRISEEAFFPEQPILTSLKMRIGYGVSGNQAPAAFASRGTISDSPLYYEFGINNTPINSYRTQKPESPELSWERTAATNIGLDFEFMDGRISGSAEYYYTQTSDLLLAQTLPPQTGITSIYANIGETENRGLELSVNASVINKRDFTWNTTVTYYQNDEKITSLNRGVQKDLLNGWHVGYPVSVYYDYEFDGIWQLWQDDNNNYEVAALYGYVPGDIKFKDLNGDTAITVDDRTIIGTPRPKWIGGWTNTLTYKNFDLSIIAFFRQGQTIRDQVRSYFSPNGLNNSMKLDYWKPDDSGISSNTTPRLDKNRTLSGYSELRALEYTDGSFMKIKDITLGYSLPSDAAKVIGASKCRVYFTVKNALIASKFGDYKFFGGAQDRNDPELKGSIDLPMPRLFAGGVNVTF